MEPIPATPWPISAIRGLIRGWDSKRIKLVLLKSSYCQMMSNSPVLPWSDLLVSAKPDNVGLLRRWGREVSIHGLVAERNEELLPFPSQMKLFSEQLLMLSKQMWWIQYCKLTPVVPEFCCTLESAGCLKKYWCLVPTLRHSSLIGISCYLALGFSKAPQVVQVCSKVLEPLL